MAHPKASLRRTKAVFSSLFLVGLAIISFTGQWWPGILLVIGIPLGIRQFLMGRTYDMLLSFLIFIGGFIVASMEVSWEILLPVIFTIAAIYVLVREFSDPEIATEPEEEESVNKEIEEDEENV